MIVLSCKNLKKSYGIDEILKNITCVQEKAGKWGGGGRTDDKKIN